MSDVPVQPAHHFANFEQQRFASSLGMWVFLITEVMFFGGVFLLYIIYRMQNAEAFKVGSHELDIIFGTVNTVALLTSSLTMVLAVHAAKIGNVRSLQRMLFATLALGAAFLAFKAVEYSHKWEHHHVPGPNFHFAESHHSDVEHPLSRGIEMFFGLYFFMTGLHAIHMIIGMVILFILMVQVYRQQSTMKLCNTVDNFGLYWHFVDIVWIFLFPLLYLIGRH